MQNVFQYEIRDLFQNSHLDRMRLTNLVSSLILARIDSNYVRDSYTS